MSVDEPKRVPQSERNLSVAAELQPSALGLMIAWAHAKQALETGVPNTMENNPWHPTNSGDGEDELSKEAEPLSELTKRIVAS